MYKKGNGKILVTITIMAAITSCTTSKKTYLEKITEEFTSQPLKNESVLSVQEIAHLPVCVQKYLAYTGAVGRSKIQNMYIEFDADMYRKPGEKPMKSHSEQYNFYDNYSRLFLMKASKIGIPFSALHVYRDEAATFRVKVAELIKVVDIGGEELTKAETVTVLNDLCLFAPGCLADRRLSWSEEETLSAKVTLASGRYVVSATLYFNGTCELVNFVSDDRSALQDDGTLKQARWETPVSGYIDIEGRKIPAFGKTTWKYAEGDFTYGVFRLRSIKYNLMMV